MDSESKHKGQDIDCIVRLCNNINVCGVKVMLCILWCQKGNYVHCLPKTIDRLEAVFG